MRHGPWETERSSPQGLLAGQSEVSVSFSAADDPTRIADAIGTCFDIALRHWDRAPSTTRRRNWILNAQGLDWVAPALEPGEEVDLFGGAFEIERLPEPRPDQLTAAFVMTRRDDGATETR